ncbi:MAG TPA: tetratricopeptide repeat protein [Pyrinomonadaceae bacterium]|jgi:tetratricopeptide (TPR) repeat protein
MSSLYQKLKVIFPSMIRIFSHRQKVLSAFFTLFLVASFAQAALAQAGDVDVDQAVKLFNQGQDAHEKGDFAAAVKSYEEALKIFPEFAEAEFQRGNALLSLEKPAEAEKAFRRALELREDWTLPMTSLGALLVEQNNFADAEKFLTKAVELDDSNFLAYSALTDLRLKTKADADVLKTLLEKLKILTSKAKPTASVWASRAALENALGDKTSAKTSLGRALLIDSANKTALMQRAEIALAESDIKGAAQDAQTLARIAPNSVPVKLLQARVLAAEGKPEEAVKLLDSISNPSAETTSLRNKISAGDTENVAELEKQLETDQKNALLLGRLCVLERVVNAQKALEYCRRASELEPNNLNHAVGYGAALVQAKNYENAVIILKKITAIAPDNFTSHANLATALFQLKRYNEAIEEYNWLTQKQPELAITYYFLAISYDSLGQYLDAMANYQQFLKLADAKQNQVEIEKVNLRLPTLQKQIKKK